LYLILKGLKRNFFTLKNKNHRSKHFSDRVGVYCTHVSIMLWKCVD